MSMIVIDLEGASMQIEGVLARRLLEVRPGVFVGNLSKRAIEVIWEAIEISKPRSALVVFPAKTESGIAVKTLGEHRYVIVENFGLQLMATVRSHR